MMMGCLLTSILIYDILTIKQSHLINRLHHSSHHMHADAENSNQLQNN